MSDTPEIIRRYIDMQQAKARYNDAVRSAGETPIKEIKEYMEMIGFYEEPDYSDKIYKMIYKKEPEFWIPLPKRKLIDSSLILFRAISQLDELGEL